MDTITTNTQGDLNVCLAADDIIEIFEKLGFTSDILPDIELLRHSIIDAIEKRMMSPNIKVYTHDEMVNEYEKFFS